MSDKPANKIVSSNRLSLKPSLNMFKAITEGVPKSERDEARKRLIRKSKRVRMEKGFWKTPQGKISKSARNTQRLKVKSDVKRVMNHPEFKKMVHQKGWKPISLEQQLKQFRSLDDSIKFQKGEYRGKHFSDSQKMAKAYYDNLYKFHKTNETRNLQLQIKERGRLLHEINKKLKAGVTAPNIPKASQLKISNLSRLKSVGSGLGNLGAGIVINALADKYLYPQSERLAEFIAPPLVRWAKDFDEKYPWLDNQLNKKNAKKKEEK